VVQRSTVTKNPKGTKIQKHRGLEIGKEVHTFKRDSETLENGTYCTVDTKVQF
jgi:hypothetical protein